jgi:hypothetical protein
MGARPCHPLTRLPSLVKVARILPLTFVRSFLFGARIRNNGCVCPEIEREATERRHPVRVSQSPSYVQTGEKRIGVYYTARCQQNVSISPDMTNDVLTPSEREVESKMDEVIWHGKVLAPHWLL